MLREEKGLVLLACTDIRGSTLRVALETRRSKDSVRGTPTRVAGATVSSQSSAVPRVYSALQYHCSTELEEARSVTTLCTGAVVCVNGQRKVSTGLQ